MWWVVVVVVVVVGGPTHYNKHYYKPYLRALWATTTAQSSWTARGEHGEVNQHYFGKVFRVEVTQNDPL